MYLKAGHNDRAVSSSNGLTDRSEGRPGLVKVLERKTMFKQLYLVVGTLLFTIITFTTITTIN